MCENGERKEKMRSKEKYNNIPLDKQIKCKVCGNVLPKKFFGIRNLLESGELGVCSYCDWKKDINISFLLLKVGMK